MQKKTPESWGKGKPEIFVPHSKMGFGRRLPLRVHHVDMGYDRGIEEDKRENYIKEVTLVALLGIHFVKF